MVSKLVLLGVDTLVICGVSTSGCVRATTLDALSYNFRPMVRPPRVVPYKLRSTDIGQVVGTACGDRSPAIHDSNINDMDAKMADVVTEEDAIKHMQAGWP